MTRGVAGIAGVAVLLVLLVGVAIYDGSRSDRIADGVRIGSVDVGGRDVGDARDRLRRALADRVGRPIVATYRRQRFVLRPELVRARLDVEGSVEAARERGRQGNFLGRTWRGATGGDVEATVAPQVTYTRSAVTAFAARIAGRVDRRARDADVNVHDGRLELRHSRAGVQVRRGQLVAALTSRLSAPAVAGTGDLKLPVTLTRRPDHTLDELARAKRNRTMIAIDRDAKKLRLYKRLKLARTYRIAVGKAGLESTAGRYEIQEKIVDPPWHVPNSSWAGELAGRTIPAGDPQNPLEARWMGFHEGQGIHGTKDISSLGEAASHGCIRMSAPAVKQLFRQVRVGTPVILQ